MEIIEKMFRKSQASGSSGDSDDSFSNFNEYHGVVLIFILYFYLLVNVILLCSFCDTPNPGVPLTTHQAVEFLWISGCPLPHGRVPFIGIHISTKNQAVSPLFGELYPTNNLYNSNP